MKTVNFLLTFFAIYLAVPSLLILLSWNALPGHKLYSVKTGLEKLVMVATSSTPLASQFALQFTERRFSEADKLLAQQGSTIGYTLLVNQAQQSKEIIVQKQDHDSAEELVEKIEIYQEEITKTVQEKAGVITPGPTVSQPSPPAQTTQPTPASKLPTQPTPALKRETPSVLPGLGAQPPTISPQPQQPRPESPEEVVKKLEDTKEKLEKIKKEIKREVPMQVLKSKEKHRENDKDKGRGKEREKEKENAQEETKEDKKDEEKSDESDKSDGKNKQSLFQSE